MSCNELQLSLEQVQEGMRLARDLCDANGQVLMTSGTPLSATAIASLQRRMVEHLWVLLAQPQSAETTVQDGARHQHHKERLARLFRHTGESAEGRYLMDILTRYREAEPS